MFYNENFDETSLPIGLHGNFLQFLNHIKSSSSTTVIKTGLRPVSY